MRSSTAATARRSSGMSAGGRSRSVGFATIEEEEDDSPDWNKRSSTRLSEISLTLDDLDAGALTEDIPNLHLPDASERKPKSRLEIPVPDRMESRETSSGAQSRQQSSQSGVVPSILRRFTRSKLSSDVTSQSEAWQPPPEHLVRNSGTTVGGVRNRGDRRATLFTRHRQSLGTARSSMTSSGSTFADNGEGNGNSYCLPDATIRVLREIINNRVWKAFILFFILVLLFGPPIQDLCLPKGADVWCDVIFTIALVILGVDIIMRASVDKSYFSWDRKGNAWAPPHHKMCASKYCNIHCGSFMFWFDTVALLTVLYRISYTNPRMNEMNRVEVGMDERGFPKTGHHATPVHMDWAMILTVGRVGLMARFIRTSVLVDLSRNFYWLRFFNPKYWWRQLTSECGYGRNEKRNVARASQRVLASSSKGRDETKSELFSASAISALGESNPSRRWSASSNGMGGEKLEPCAEEPELEEDSKHATARRFFKGKKHKATDSGESLDDHPPILQSDSFLLGKGSSKEEGSHVGAAMRELTGQRIATGALFAIVVTVVCSWREVDTTEVMTMLVLHGQTANAQFAELSVNVARKSVIPNLFNYTRANETNAIFSETYELADNDVEDLRSREILLVNITRDNSDEYTTGLFDKRQLLRDGAEVELVLTILILFVWAMGVSSFVGPVMTLVVEPIERMVKLLSMLMKDPLGYQNTPEYRKLKREEDEIADKSGWRKEVLRGMETNFLMSTILRIGSLMRVGFGSAGVEIIRNNLERGRHKDVLFLSKQGSSVSCIFLFCDIRQFTDATECLQEEVFVFTNKIAAVVHSICNSYGGSANKNIGDAFLLSWLLDESQKNQQEEEDDDPFQSSSRYMDADGSDLHANSNQADKALLSVVKIQMALHYDNFFLDDMNEAAKNRLLTKLSKRKGPVVQMGFGLHAGKAVQGAIGSQRKLDATYISESVERSEFLESSTKKYGVPLLMSDAFYGLLSSYNRYRCRKVDQLLLLTEQDEGVSDDPNEILDTGEKMSIYTFDMDVDALWRVSANDEDSTASVSDIDQRLSSMESRRTTGSLSKRRSLVMGSRRNSFSTKDMSPPLTRSSQLRRSSLIPIGRQSSKEVNIERIAAQVATEEMAEKPTISRRLVLPTATSHYSEKAWLEPDIKTIRRDYVANGIIFPKYQEGLKSYYARDWVQARKCFEFVLTQRDDGPSRYFLEKMAEHDGVVPRNFIGYSIER